MGAKLIDLTGQRIPNSRLTAVKRLPNDAHGKTVWFCVCDCGNSIATRRERLRNGECRSCGCLHLERARQLYKLSPRSRKGGRK